MEDRDVIQVVFLVLGGYGKIMKSEQVMVGLDMIQNISNMRAHDCLKSCNRIDLNTGLMEINWEISKLKKAIVKVSDKVVIITTVEKIDEKQKFLVCGIDEINRLIMEADRFLQGFGKMRLHVI